MERTFYAVWGRIGGSYTSALHTTPTANKRSAQYHARKFTKRYGEKYTAVPVDYSEEMKRWVLVEDMPLVVGGGL